MSTSADYLESVRKLFRYYKKLGEQAMEQLHPEQLFLCPNPESNSIATIAKHLWGNMRSRWTDFFTSDGEKPWRQRDEEFENDWTTREEVMEKWEEGWACFLDTLDRIQESDLERIVYIRNEGHTVLEAINRQLAHYPYHVGQMIFAAKTAKTGAWDSLSIPRNQSASFNADKFARDKQRKHFTDGR
ncbi:MAG: DUF1572 family protein [Haliscomenobacter sp.]|nr:DUF1572 family protein [Haliscomenobacter sp.]